MHWTACPALLVLLSLSSSFAKSVTPHSEILVDDLITSFRDLHPQVYIEPLSNIGRIKEPKQYEYGPEKAKNGPLPDPVLISSFPIRINSKGNVSDGKEPPSAQVSNRNTKREVLIQDSSQYLNSQAVPLRQQTLVDGSVQQNQQRLYYTQQPQQYTLQQDPATGAIYGTPAPMQLQSVTAMPISNNQMYVLQPDGDSYAALYQNKNTQYDTNFLARAGEMTQGGTEQVQDASIVTPLQILQPKVSIVSHADPQSQQASKKQEQAQKTQQQIQYEDAQQVLQNVIKQQALQQAQQQRQQHFQQQLQQQQQQAQKQIQDQIEQEVLEQVQQAAAAQAQLQQAAAAQTQLQVAAQQAAEDSQKTTILFNPTTSTLQTHIQPEQQLPPQLVQVQQRPQQRLPVQTIYQATNGQTYIIKQNPHTVPDSLQERHSTGHPTNPMQTPSNNFVIRHQTYVTGPGGQMFTVPIPVPATQVQEEPQHSGSREDNSREPSDDDKEQRSAENEKEDIPPSRQQKPMNSFMRRILDAFSVRGDPLQRVETNIALPILASTGVFFGLGALAAGWYLSHTNREVGILRRTGRPVPPGSPNVKRIRRLAPGPPSEVDQATFFQTIIQQAIEKQQEHYDGAEPNTAGIEPEFIQEPQRYTPTKYGRPKPNNRHDMQEELYETSASNSKVSQHPIQNKSWLGSRHALNFAKVAIPAIVLGGAVIAIGVLIFGWYITGSNREIAFLEPSAYSRRKRDLTTTALSDGWVQRVLTSIHENPYEKESGGGEGNNFLDPMSYPDTSKNNLEYHANLSDAVVAVSLAVVAFFSLMGIVLAWFFSENEKSNIGITGNYGFGGWPNNNYRSTRSKRDLFSSNNDLTSGHLAHNPTFLDSILTSLDVSQNSLLAKLQETGYSKWQETPCAKRIFCDVMSTQSTDTNRAMEKRMATFISMLPGNLTSALSKTLGEVMSAIQRSDCSAFTCGGHWVDPSIIDQPSPPTNQPR